MGTNCPRCMTAVALHDGRPNVTPAGTVELWHRDCWNRPAEIIALPAPSAPRSSRGARLVWAAIASSAVIAIGVSHFAFAEVVPPPPVASIATFDVTHAEPGPIIVEAHEVLPPKPTHVTTPLEDHYQM